MAAVQAAAAQAAKESSSNTEERQEPVKLLTQTPVPPAAAGKERERLVERLRGVCQGGSVVPVPFLRAAHAVPAAILDDMRAPYMSPAHVHAPMVNSITLSTAHQPSPTLISFPLHTSTMQQPAAGGCMTEPLTPCIAAVAHFNTLGASANDVAGIALLIVLHSQTAPHIDSCKYNKASILELRSSAKMHEVDLCCN